ncbi:DUF6221 family protein [Streptomyces lancefieldiae]|uniref:DUF6221 family protein n=1 Tax=Streptomyces lancefieldiae TaxID=3075520 RepID=A0ABU3AFY9_9ACTN|nr:DUF6221 family protein [Streptomyces sp. DSM 40712]MDT0608853.1 DUF6221 family protein [Streptomyces sp. DSM 40712]
MDDLAQWLRAQLDEDERIARAATEGPWSVDDNSYAEAIYAADRRTTVVAGGRWGGEASVFESTEDALHIAAHDPARVLREIDTKWKILVECVYWHGKLAGEAAAPSPAPFPALGEALDAVTPILRARALPYVDRPGYREEWRP